VVTPAYFETLGIAMKRGRSFTDRDRAGSLPVAAVNEALVQRYLPGLDPLAQRLLIVPFAYGETPTPPEPIEVQVVGVFGDVPNSGAEYRAVSDGGTLWDRKPEIALPFWQFPWPSVTMAVRTAGEARAVQPALAEIIARLDPDLPMTDVLTMEQVLSDVRAGDRFHTVLLGAFAAAALVLAVVGIYGVMSFVVAQRSQEIGVRMALGAGRWQVVRQLLREGMTTAVIGSVAGAVGVWLVGRAMQGLVYGVEATPAWLFVVVALTLLGAAALACLVPARRAASVDPMVALRQE
jgi:putative ABC transport system permease protein